MKNVTLDSTTALQLDSDATDGALYAAADGDVLGNDTALDLCAIADQKVGGAQLAFDAAEHLRRTIAFDPSDDRHARAYARGHSNVRRRLRLRRGSCDGRRLRLHCPDHFNRICLRALNLVACLALAIKHVHSLSAATRETFARQRDWLSIRLFRHCAMLPDRQADRKVAIGLWLLPSSVEAGYSITRSPNGPIPAV